MSELMKDVRDIRLIGIGVLLGMVLFYFLTLEQSAPRGTRIVTMNLAQSAPVSSVTNLIEGGKFLEELGRPFVWPGEATLKKYGQPLIDRSLAPDFQPGRMRVVPARQLDSESYDLIDLNYVPDFNVPTE
jgi:hypothetical protein